MPLKNQLTTKNKYYVTVEIRDFYSTKKEQFDLIIDAGRKPTLGDYIEMLKQNLKIDMQIKEIAPHIEFKPITPIERGIQLVRILRAVHDTTYAPVTRI